MNHFWLLFAIYIKLIFYEFRNIYTYLINISQQVRSLKLIQLEKFLTNHFHILRVWQIDVQEGMQKLVAVVLEEAALLVPTLQSVGG